MIYIYLTPQEKDYCPFNKTPIVKYLSEHIRAMKEETSFSTYLPILMRSAHEDMGLYSERIAKFEEYKNQLTCPDNYVLCDGTLRQIRDTYDSIMEEEAKAYERIKDMDITKLPNTPQGQVIHSALIYYKGLYLEKNEEEVEDKMIDSIKKSREEAAEQIDTELDLIMKLVTNKSLGILLHATIYEGEKATEYYSSDADLNETGLHFLAEFVNIMHKVKKCTYKNRYVLKFDSGEELEYIPAKDGAQFEYSISK